MHRPSPTLRLSLLLLAGAGCLHGAAPASSQAREAAASASSEPVAPSLGGLALPLLTTPALRLSVAGSLGGRPVPVALDVSRPLSTASVACFGKQALVPEGVVRAHEPSGGLRNWSMVRLTGLRLGEAVLPARPVGLSGESTCAVTLGLDVLAPYALEVDPARRQVSFIASRPREAHAAQLAEAGEDAALETHLVELTREPSGDWPLLAARVQQGEAELIGPFVLGSREPFSRVDTRVAEREGLRPLETQAGLPARAFAVDSVEVAREVGVGPLVLEADSWLAPTSLGRLGPDVWGRFQATVDAQGGALVLRRPRVREEEGRVRCARPGSEGFSEEACYALHTRTEAGGTLAVTGALFRDMPEGGRLHLEPLGADGQRLEARCRVGLVFAPTGRGATTQHRLPWASLAQTLPECHAELGAVRGWRLALFEEGALPECGGRTCAFVQHLESRRTACDCQPTPLGDGVATVPRRAPPSREPPREERELEPEDPK